MTKSREWVRAFWKHVFLEGVQNLTRGPKMITFWVIFGHPFWVVFYPQAIESGSKSGSKNDPKMSHFWSILTLFDMFWTPSDTIWTVCTNICNNMTIEYLRYIHIGRSWNDQNMVKKHEKMTLFWCSKMGQKWVIFWPHYFWVWTGIWVHLAKIMGQKVVQKVIKKWSQNVKKWSKSGHFWSFWVISGPPIFHP